MSTNVDIVNDMYAAFAHGDAATVLGHFDPQIEWNEADGFPYADGNPYRGPDAVAEGVFGRIGNEWDGWALDIEQVHDAGDSVIARGRYRATHKQTGKEINAQFAHVWWLQDGKATRFQQYADTLQVNAAMK